MNPATNALYAHPIENSPYEYPGSCGSVPKLETAHPERNWILR